MEVASVSNNPLPAPSCFPPHYRPPSAPTWLPGLPTSTAPPASNIPPVCAGGSSAAGHPEGRGGEGRGVGALKGRKMGRWVAGHPAGRGEGLGGKA